MANLRRIFVSTGLDDAEKGIQGDRVRNLELGWRTQYIPGEGIVVGCGNGRSALRGQAACYGSTGEDTYW